MAKKILIVGAGTAGITVAARLSHRSENFEITIIDPAETHFYQPLWTLVGAGVGKKEATAKPMSAIIPRGVNWVKDSVKTFIPENNQILLSNETEPLNYDYLVVCPGIQIDWDKIEGLKENIGKNGVCSNYDYKTVESTWKAFQETKSGNALFTFPNTPIKCGGAPQKIMYLADDYFRQLGIRNKINVEYTSAGAGIFGVEKYKVALQKVVDKKEIKTSYQINLEKIDGEKKIAYFRDLNSNEIIEKEFSMIHVAPPQSAPDFVKNSPLAGEDGWIDTDQYSLQHTKYENIFCLGDAANLPTGRTGAAIRKQAPVLVKNLIAHLYKKPLSARYNGYSSCPLITGYGKLILAEFDYSSQPVETFPFNQAKERYSMFLLKKHILPILYWKGMLKGWA